MSDIITQFLMQLLGQTPMLLVYLIGMGTAFVFWRRCPSTAVLVLLGSGLLLLISVEGTFAFQYIIQSRHDWGWRDEKMGTVLTALGLVNSVIGALAFALLLAAAFVGRRGQSGSDVV